MSLFVLYKLLAIFGTAAIGWFAGRMRWLGSGEAGNDPARVLSAAAFYIFMPALLFRATARLDLAQLPWPMLAAFFAPLLALMLAIYGWQRWRLGAAAAPAAPSVLACNSVFGSTMQVGVPMAAGVFGEQGLGLHITVMSLHSTLILCVLTTLVELDLARAQRAGGGGEHALLATLATTARNTLIHPVVLPVLAGLAWHALGLPLPAVADEVLQTLGTAVVPLCLTLIGMSLAYYGWPADSRGVLGVVALKLLALPALVLAVARWGLGVSGLPLAVLVMMAALPSGSNALIFAQRYRTLERESTAALVLSTLLFMLTAPLWLMLLASLEGPLR